MNSNKEESEQNLELNSSVSIDEIEKFPEIRKDQIDGVFIDFSQEGALNKLINLSKCPFNERLTYTKHIADLLQLIGEAGNDHLKNIIGFIIADNDDIKRTLLLQLPHVIENLKTQLQGYEQMRDILTPALFQLIANDNLDIKEDSGKILAQIGDIMNGDDRGKYILTKVLNMAHDDLVDDNRIVAIQMAHCFGTDLCEQFVGLEILSLGEDPQLRVRKESVLNLPIIGKVVSQEFFQHRLLPFFIKKSQDSFWGIRKACVEIIVDISNVCSTKVKENQLTEILLNCLKDQSKWVKISAYKNLGPFIVTLENCHASEKLFDHYTKMTDSTINSLSNENEILIACAQFFPAVLKVYGEKKWSILQKTFMLLLKSNIKKVKKPIACSLHEIAIILGQEKAEKDLFNVLDSILKDPNDEVKYGAISHLAQFMQVFDSQKRENFLDVFLILQKDPKKWRIRELIARQIDLLAKMFNSETVFRYIMPISFKLCNDTVSIVREEAARQVPSILLQLAKEKDTSDIFLGCVVDNIRAFSFSTRFNQRQTFISMCNQLMMYPDIFKKSFLDIFEILSKDKVVNVRISLAQAISQHIRLQGPLSEDPTIKKIIDVLKQDKSRDVRSHFVSVEDFVKQNLAGKQEARTMGGSISSTSQIAPKQVNDEEGDLTEPEQDDSIKKEGVTNQAQLINIQDEKTNIIPSKENKEVQLTNPQEGMIDSSETKISKEGIQNPQEKIQESTQDKLPEQVKEGIEGTKEEKSNEQIEEKTEKQIEQIKESVQEKSEEQHQLKEMETLKEQTQTQEISKEQHELLKTQEISEEQHESLNIQEISEEKQEQKMDEKCQKNDIDNQNEEQLERNIVDISVLDMSIESKKNEEDGLIAAEKENQVKITE